MASSPVEAGFVGPGFVERVEGTRSSAAREEVAAAPERSAESRRVIQLDFIRGIAILAVMEYHFYTIPVANPLARAYEFLGKGSGWLGVDLFFVLSGFLVGGLLVQELLQTGGIRVGRFLLRRMLKIWPAYYAFLLFQLLLHKHPAMSYVWQNGLNIQNYTGTALLHTWSLAIEEHFYLGLPFLLLWIYRSPWRRRHTLSILGGFCLLVLAWRTVNVYAYGNNWMQFNTHTRMDSLLFGVILSYVLYAHREWFDRLLKHGWALFGLGLFGIAFGLQGHLDAAMNSFGYTVNYLCLGALVLAVYGYRGRLTRTWIYRSIAWIGVYSYSIFLWHLLVREPLKAVTERLPAGMQWGALLLSQYAAGITLGVLMSKAVEFPMLRLRERWVPRGPAKLAPESA